MPRPIRNFSRSARVSDVIHRALAKLIREEFQDPRVGMITISTVDVAPDLKQAKIFVTVLENEKALDTVRILNQASGFFRSRLSKLLTLRSVPNLSFRYDESVVRGNRIESLLARAIGSCS